VSPVLRPRGRKICYVTTLCAQCDQEVPQARFGRARRYCSDACRQRGFRQRSGAFQAAGRVLVSEIEEDQVAIDDQGTVPGAQVQVTGGFGADSATMKYASPTLRRRAALADLEHEQHTRDERRAAAVEAEARHERAVMVAAQMALERGEITSLAEAYRNPAAALGHTKSEFLALVSAQQDAEDARLAAAARKAYQRWLNQESEDASVDMSAPLPAEVSAAEADRVLEEQRQVQRGKQIGRQRERRQFRSEARKIAKQEVTIERWRQEGR
jgi:hypothetical protein